MSRGYRFQIGVLKSEAQLLIAEGLGLVAQLQQIVRHALIGSRRRKHVLIR
jgi:hypothetical protein